MNGSKGVKMTTGARYDDWLMARLADADFAADYLNAASEDDDFRSYLTALRKVVEARGGMADVAAKSELSRETLYRTRLCCTKQAPMAGSLGA
jgi:DNA-binding phage protein